MRERSARHATEHPRPLLRRPWVDLDGEWEFSPDDAQEHTNPATPGFESRIRVPYSPETPASGIHWKGPLSQSWYRTRLPEPDPTRSSILHFGAIDREADIWIGDHHVGRHEGGYTPFELDITEALRHSSVLSVRARDDQGNLDVPRGKQDWRPEAHHIFYPHTSGIWQSVWIEHVAPVRIESVEWRCDPRTLTVQVRVRTNVPALGHKLAIRLTHGTRVLVDDTVVVLGQETTRTFHVGDGGFDDRVILVWSPTQPTLLPAEIALLDARGELVDEVRSYTALRDVRCEDGEFLLNGRPQQLRLVLDQGYWPETGLTPPDTLALAKDLYLAAELGFNGARKHQKREDLRYLAWADQIGMMVWAEMPSAYRSGTTSAQNLLHEWHEAVVAQRGHPSVVAWVPANESWGVESCEREPRQRALLRALAELTDALDGTRPVSVNDGWETLGGGIAGIHDYTAHPEILRERYGSTERIEHFLRSRRHDGRLADLERAGLAGRTAVLSEFGGISLEGSMAINNESPLDVLDNTQAWGYSDATSPAELVARCTQLWDAVRASSGLAGACWTQLTDTYQEINGLLDAQRRPKAEPAALRAAITGER